MTSIWRKLLVLTITIILGLSVYGYFQLYIPLTEQIAQKQMELDVSKTEQVALETRIRSVENSISKPTTMLQKKLPVARQLENLLLDLYNMEVRSNTEVNGISFNTGMDEPEIIISSGEQSVNLKKIQFSLSVDATNYFDMMEFMKLIEVQERIMKLERITFSGPQEIISVDEESDDINFELLVSSYYYPTLSNLIDELPEIVVPSYIPKDSPFANFEGMGQ